MTWLKKVIEISHCHTIQITEPCCNTPTHLFQTPKTIENMRKTNLAINLTTTQPVQNLHHASPARVHYSSQISTNRPTPPQHQRAVLLPDAKCINKSLLTGPPTNHN